MPMIIAATMSSDSPDTLVLRTYSVWRMVEQSNDDRRAAHDDDQIIRVVNPPTQDFRDEEICADRTLRGRSQSVVLSASPGRVSQDAGMLYGGFVLADKRSISVHTL